MSDGLFVKRIFRAHSGEIKNWKIECDALTDLDMYTLAFMLYEILPPFDSVYGIPKGGLRIANELRIYQTSGPRLVVDDVLTTGASMIQEMREGDIGAVIFARGVCPDKVTPLFQKTLRPIERIKENNE